MRWGNTRPLRDSARRVGVTEEDSTLPIAYLSLMSRTLSFALVLALSLVRTAPVEGQGTPAASSWLATRADLERRLTSLEALATSQAYSERARARAAGEVASIRRRLSDGDFRVGDRVYVEVEASVLVGAEAAPQSTVNVRDTLTVLQGSRINVRGIGEVSLVGVLRSELQSRVSAAVNEVLLDARTSTRPLVRLAVLGAVARPGYFAIPLEYRIDDLLMLAGGPAPNSQAQSMQVFRGDTIVLSAEEVREYIASGTVISEIGLQEGDQLFIGRGEEPVERQQLLQFVFIFVSPIITTIMLRLISP